MDGIAAVEWHGLTANLPDLPSNYNLAQNFPLCGRPLVNEGAVFAVANDKPYDPKKTDWHWSCALDQAGSATNGVLCRWNSPPTTDSGCSPPHTDQDVTNSTCGLSASGKSLVSSPFAPNNGDPLLLEVAIATPNPGTPSNAGTPVTPPTSITGCVSSWTPVNGGSLSFGSQSNPNQGYIAWYSGTSNNDGQPCKVTVTLAESAAATLKVYDVPGYNGTPPETISNASGSVAANTPQPAVYAQPPDQPAKTANAKDLMLGSLLQVNQQPTPLTWWEDWLTNSLTFPNPINCENFQQSSPCPTDDGTDYLSAHGPYSSNADAGHRAVGPGTHALERSAHGGMNSTAFNWGGVAIYIEIKPIALAVGCPPLQTATVGMPYSSSYVTSGGEPDYMYQLTSGKLPMGVIQLGPNSPYIYGVPTTPKTYQFTVQVTDNLGNKASSSLCSITVSQ
jgi:hypothetical protein